MRALVFILSTVLPILLAKEHMQSEDISDDAKNLLYELVKRLEKSTDSETDVELGSRKQNIAQCDVSTKKNFIIKEVESVTNGAKFIMLHRDVSNDACSELCCNDTSCDQAVFKNKDDHVCFLFHCDGKCKFKEHPSYISNTITHSPPQPMAEDDSRELQHTDLNQHVKSEPTTDDRPESVTTVAPTTTSVAASTSTSTTTVTVIKDQSGEVCAPPAFACLTVDSGPQCVSQDAVCDSVAQCEDGSDEYNCPETDEPQEEDDDESEDDDKIAKQDGEASENAAESNMKDSGGDDTALHPSSVATTPSAPATTTTTTTTTASSTASHSTTAATAGSDPVLKEQLDGGSEEMSMQVPIVALSVGLACTLFLLIFVGCRLHRVRRQLGKSRPLHINEADYLINGMYL